MRRRNMIAVIGPGKCDAGLGAIAHATGQAIARAGFVLLTGGLGGVMQEASRGASESGGLVVGILPGADPKTANPYVEIALSTGMGQGRNLLLVSSASGVIVLGGSSGTLSEIALAWRVGRPIVAITSSGGYAAELAGRCLDDRSEEPIGAAKTPAQAIALLSRRIGN